MLKQKEKQQQQRQEEEAPQYRQQRDFQFDQWEGKSQRQQGRRVEKPAAPTPVRRENGGDRFEAFRLAQPTAAKVATAPPVVDEQKCEQQQQQDQQQQRENRFVIGISQRRHRFVQ
ncbi:MAG: hypothetical protein GY820_06410 [Gammaproteobacteria bacterium]|nr:hypothetical protein [Gammaproteobacteria bacterium]